uniref:Uncharacterized protein n=2 Tax=Sus scrofa TaxID=9823 RepID=A0A4X1VWF4_PIG
MTPRRCILVSPHSIPLPPLSQPLCILLLLCSHGAPAPRRPSLGLCLPCHLGHTSSVSSSVPRAPSPDAVPAARETRKCGNRTCRVSFEQCCPWSKGQNCYLTPSLDDRVCHRWGSVPSIQRMRG